MIPHEKTLVERLKNEPFALIGINTDSDKAEYRKQIAANGITWRSAWDGSTRGPLCTAWGISSFPTIYVLDAKGTIRHIGLRGPQLEEAVDALIREAKAGGPDPGAKDAQPAPKVPKPPPKGPKPAHEGSQPDPEVPQPDPEGPEEVEKPDRRAPHAPELPGSDSGMEGGDHETSEAAESQSRTGVLTNRVGPIS